MKRKNKRKYEEGGTAGGTMQVRTRLNTMPRIDQVQEPFPFLPPLAEMALQHPLAPHNILGGGMLGGMMMKNGGDAEYSFGGNAQNRRTMDEIARLNYNDALQKADTQRMAGIPFFGYGPREQHITEGPRTQTGNPFQDVENLRAHAYRHVIPRNNRGNMGMLANMMGMAPMPFANGGEVPDEYLTGAASDSDITVPGGTPVDINAESQEFIETPEGEGFKIPGNVSHENTSLRPEGGVNMTVPENSFIYPKGKWTKRKESREKQAQNLYKELEKLGKAEGILEDNYKKNSILQKLKNLQLEDESDRYEITKIKEAKEAQGADSRGFQDGGHAEKKKKVAKLVEEAWGEVSDKTGYSKKEVASGKAAEEFAIALNAIFKRENILLSAFDLNDPTKISIEEIDSESGIMSGRTRKEVSLPVEADGSISGSLGDAATKAKGWWEGKGKGFLPFIGAEENIANKIKVRQKARKDFTDNLSDVITDAIVNPQPFSFRGESAEEAKRETIWDEAAQKWRPPTEREILDRMDIPGAITDPGVSGGYEPSDIPESDFISPGPPDLRSGPEPGDIPEDDFILPDDPRLGPGGGTTSTTTPSTTSPTTTSPTTTVTPEEEEEDFYKVKGFGKDVDDLASKIGKEGKEEGEEFDSGNYLERAKRIGADYINNQSQLLQLMFPGGPERKFPNYWKGIQNKSLRDLDKMAGIVDQQNKIAKKDSNIDFATMKDMIADYNPQRQGAKFAGLFNAKRNQDRKQYLADLNAKAKILGMKANYNFKGETLSRKGADKALELEDQWRTAYGQSYGALNNFMYQDAASNLRTAKDLELEAMKFNSLNDAFGFQTDNQGNLTMKKNKPMETVKNGGPIRRKYKRGSVVKKMYDNRASNPSPNMTSDRDPYFWGALAKVAAPLVGNLLGGVLGGGDKEEDKGGGGGLLGGLLGGGGGGLGSLLGGLFEHGGHTNRYGNGGPSLPGLGGGGGGFPKPPGFGGGGGFPMPPGMGGGGRGFPKPPGFGGGFPGLGGGNNLQGLLGSHPGIAGPMALGRGIQNAQSPQDFLGLHPGIMVPQMMGNAFGTLGGGMSFRNGGRANGRPSYGPGAFVDPPEAPTTGGSGGMDWGNILQGLIGFNPMAQQMPDPDAIPKPTQPGAGATQEEWENYYKLLAMWQKMSKKPEQQSQPGGLLGSILGGGDKKGGGIDSLLNMMPHRQMMNMMGQRGMGMGMMPGMGGMPGMGSGAALRQQQANYLNSRNPYFA